MKNELRIVCLAAVCAAVVLFVSCVTEKPSIPEGLGAAEIFQRAQDAADRGDFELGITYYTLYRDKFPDDAEHDAWASYEIAFLYHKMGKNDTALTLVNQLLDQYARQGDTLPPAPRILADKLKTRLEAAAPKKQ